MTEIPDRHEDAAKTYLHNDETAVAAHTDWIDESNDSAESFIVTHDRILQIRSGSDQEDHDLKTESVYFDNVTSVSITEHDPRPYKPGYLLLAGITGLLGVVAWVSDFVQQMADPGPVLVVGPLFVVTFALAFDAFNTEDPHIEIGIQTAQEDGEHSVDVPKSARELAAAVSSHAI